MLKGERNCPKVDIGTKAGLLTVIGPLFRVLYSGSKQYMCVCECDCGRYAVKSASDILRGRTVSCGCSRLLCTESKRIASQNRYKITTVWFAIISRCHDANNLAYRNYGGRGIYVDDEWRLNKEAFIEWCIANNYTPGLQVDRIDNDGPYKSDNCRLVTRKQNLRNKRNNRILSCFGESKTATDWAEDSRCLVPKRMFLDRITQGWEPERAMTERKQQGIKVIDAFGEAKTIARWSCDSRCVVPYKTLLNRLKSGITAEIAMTRPLRSKRK